ncbi:MAG: hypothetical protein ACLUYZ_04455 [Lachnospiraceae bacterium]
MPGSAPAITSYPDPYCRRLVQAIAGHEQVPASYILCGNGAADLIYAYCAALRSRTAVELAPTFVEYGAGLTQVGWPRDAVFPASGAEFRFG